MSQILLSAVWSPNTVISCLMSQTLSLLHPDSLRSCRVFVSKWATEAFYSAFWLRIQVMYWQRYWLLHGWCTWSCCRHVSAHVLCTPYNYAPVCNVTSCKATYIGCMCFSCNLPLHFWQNDQGSLRATAVTLVCNGRRNNNQHRKCTLEKTILRLSCRDSNLRPFDHESGALTTELPPVPHDFFFLLRPLNSGSSHSESRPCRNNSPPLLPAGTRTYDLWITSPAL